MVNEFLVILGSGDLQAVKTVFFDTDKKRNPESTQVYIGETITIAVGLSIVSGRGKASP